MGCLMYGIVGIVVLVAMFISAFVCVALGFEGKLAEMMSFVLFCFFATIIGYIVKQFIDKAKAKQIAEMRLKYEEDKRIAEEKRLKKEAEAKQIAEEKRLKKEAEAKRIAEEKRLEEARQKEENARTLVEDICSKYSLDEYQLPRRQTIPAKQGAGTSDMALPKKIEMFPISF